MKSVVFDRAATFYDATRGFTPENEAKAAAALAQAGNITAATRVLEVGVGTGRIALPLARHTGAAITGVDLSVPMMERLRAKQTTERVLVAQADALRLPLATAAFDVVVVVHVFHLLSDYRPALDEIARVLRGGGVLLYAWNTYGDAVNLWPVFEAAVGIQGTQSRHGQIWRNPDFLNRDGWRHVGDPIAVPFTFQRTPNDYADQMQNRIWSSTWDLTDEQLRVGVAAVRAELARLYEDPSTPITHHAEFRVQAATPG